MGRRMGRESTCGGWSRFRAAARLCGNAELHSNTRCVCTAGALLSCFAYASSTSCFSMRLPEALGPCVSLLISLA